MKIVTYNIQWGKGLDEKVDLDRIARAERRDIGEVFLEGAGIALARIRLVPLVVIVEDDGDHVVEIDDEPVPRGPVHQQVEALVEFGEIHIAVLDIGKDVVVHGLDGVQFPPGRVILR